MTISEIESRIKQIDEELADFSELKTIITVDTDGEVDYLLELFPNYMRALRNERQALLGLIDLFCYDCARDGCSDHKGHKCEGYVERGCECEAIP